MCNKMLLAANNTPFEMLLFPCTFVETIHHFVCTQLYTHRWFQLHCPSFMWVENTQKFWVKIFTVIQNSLVGHSQSYHMELNILVSFLPGCRFLHCTRKLGCPLARNSMVKHISFVGPSSCISCLKLHMDSLAFLANLLQALEDHGFMLSS